MKKIISMFLAIAMLAMTAAAFADTGSDQSVPSGQPPFGQQQPFGGQPPSGDPPEKPDGQAPSGEQPSGQAPNGQAPSGEQPSGQPPFGQGPAGNGPVMVDFDALAQAGVISQDTCDRIKAYMEANKPADPPANDGKAPSGDRPADPPADGEAPAEGGLLKDLLDAGVITQEEYDAINAARQAVSET